MEFPKNMAQTAKDDVQIIDRGIGATNDDSGDEEENNPPPGGNPGCDGSVTVRSKGVAIHCITIIGQLRPLYARSGTKSHQIRALIPQLSPSTRTSASAAC